MAWRKWLVRGLVFSVVGGLATAALLYQRWTDPVAVRSQVLDQLEVQFPGATVHLEAARMRLLGGIDLSEVRLVRRDDPERRDVLSVPSAVIYLDKEQVLDGKLAIRKVELNRPQLRISRDRAGKWNVEGILGPQRLDERKPTLEIRDGTILVEDHRAGPDTPPLELTHVNLYIVNDPLPQLIFKATTRTGALGNLEAEGALQRASNELVLSVQATDVPVGPALLQRLAAYQPELAEQALYLDGRATLQAELAYHPEAARPWSHDCRIQLTKGKLRHPQLPLSFDQLEATARCRDGQVTLQNATARAGATAVKLKLELLDQPVHPADAVPSFEDRLQSLDVRIEELTVTPELFARLPQDLQKIQKLYSPTGSLSLTYQFQRQAEKWHKHCVVWPQNMTMAYAKFRYPLERLQGTLDHVLSSNKAETIKVDLVGYTGAQAVTIQGEVRGDGPTTGVELTIRGKDIPLDSKLQAALTPEHQKLAQAFHPTGLGDFDVSIHRPLGNREFKNRYLIRFHDVRARYDVFSYPLENVSGVLDIQQPGGWEFRDFRGTHQGCTVVTHGRSVATREGDRLAVDIRGTNLRLDEELYAALKPEWQQIWKNFTPSGRMDFEALVDRAPGAGAAPQIIVTVRPQAVTVTPGFFPYTLSDVTGSVRYDNQWVFLNQLRGRHGESVLTLDGGKVYCKTGGGVFAEVGDLQVRSLVADEDFQRALPPVLRKAAAALQLRDPVTLKTTLTLDVAPGPNSSPDLYWDGSVVLNNARLQAGVPFEQVSGRVACRGRFNGRQLESVVGNLKIDEAQFYGQPLQDVQGEFEVKKDAPEKLISREVRARLFGGELYGPLWVEFGSTRRYEMDLTASKIQLEEFGRHNLGPNAKIQGLATARLFLQGQGDTLDGLTGRGSLEVPKGKMYNLPLLLDLLKVLQLRPPDRTAFEEAYAKFEIRGPRVRVQRLDLYGDAVSLGGKGEMNLNGTDIQLDFYAVWGRVMQMLPPLLSKIPPLISQQWLIIKMRGRIGDVRFTKEPVPILVEPLKELLDRRRK